MLRLPGFTHHRPRSVAEAVALLAEFGSRGEPAKVIAGGTDLLPNMKHEITTPQHLVSLRRLGLSGVRREGTELVLGATTPVQDVADHPEVRAHLPALADACAQIAGPQLRRMGTLGGNVCLDTRCLYINQSYFWRQALGFCLKRDGTVCHVVPGGQSCVAASSNDSGPPLLVFAAHLRLMSVRGERDVPLEKLYSADGVDHCTHAADEILTEIRVPLPGPTTRAAFEKLRLRRSIDFPLSHLAVRLERQEAAAGSPLAGGELVVGVLGARPKRIVLDRWVQGRRLDTDLVDELGRRAHAACRPLTNVATEPEWRRELLPVLLRRACARLV